ncbi:MAG: hypothetical protein Q7T00_08310 [Rugosibacter sp.]|jgi:exopolysaccharide biosynthesis operon protein EpsL|nr:hypothetical protein [Rugosibacter sp.]
MQSINNYRRWLPLLVATCSTAWVGSVRADEADVFNFNLNQSVMRDSNVFRLPDDVSLPPQISTGQRADTITITSVGVVMDKLLGRQRLHADLNASRVRYAQFNFLDYDGSDIKGVWDWVLGNRWHGEVAFSQNKSLTGFSDFRSPVKSLNTYQRLSYGANYWLHPDWSVGVSMFQAKSDNSSDLRETGKFEANGAEAVAKFMPRNGNSLALRLRRTEGDYPNREPTPNGLVDNSYSQDEIEGNVGYRLTGASRVDALVAGVRRNHKQVKVRDFSGVTGRLSWSWLMSGSTQFNITTRREIGAQDDILSSFVVTRGIALGATWMPTAKTSMQASVERRVRDFLGDPVAILSSIEKRKDRLNVASLSVSYAPMTSLKLSMTLSNEERESNYSGFPYRDKVVVANAQFSF